jgi:hypothetical protein
MTVEEITNALAEKTAQDGSMDYLYAREATSVIGRIGSLVYGILTTIIIVTVPFIVALEVVYIAFPIVRTSANKLIVKIEGKGITHKIAGLTLGDAIEAVRRAETKMTGRSAMWEYVVIKCKSIMFIMFIVCLLTAGSDTLVAFLTKVVKALISVMGF